MSVLLTWEIDFSDAIGKTVILKTVDGLTAKGVLKSIDWRGIKIMGQDVEYPLTMHLSTDYHVDFSVMASFDVLDD